MQFDLTEHSLQRFIEAQDRVYESVCDELALGEKVTHWMWFIFPQLKALGRSPIAKHFGLASRDETLDYWQHPILGKRLVDCTKLVLAQRHTTARDIFGPTDDLKFKSCMTLFAQVAPDEPVFKLALDQFYEGKRDESTLKLL
jgi:uncharacterized protein (DUF1810 family)